MNFQRDELGRVSRAHRIQQVCLELIQRCWCSELSLHFDSYDYGASIRETRALSDKYDELKRQALFIRSSPEFRKTDWIGDSSTGIPNVSLNGSSAFLTLLKNPDSGTQFIIARQSDSTST